jgi:hypothetical protein
MARHGTDPDLERVAAEFGDALRRHALLNERSSEVVAALLAARSVGRPQGVPALAAQLEVVEARRLRAMAIAQTASQHLSELRRQVLMG